jgi:predicted DsbA family dithiol-disulfide isomerase
MEQQAPQSARVDIVLDLVCAHSYLAYTRFARAVARRRAEGDRIAVTFSPFQLAPQAPVNAGPLLAVLERAFGPRALDDTARIKKSAAAEGLVLDYERAVATNTFEAHRLVALAARQGLAEQAVERLFRAHFTDGIDIGDPGSLAALAGELGVAYDDSGAAETQAELDRVRAEGIRGVPVFRFGDGTVVSGSATEEELDARLAAVTPAH